MHRRNLYTLRFLFLAHMLKQRVRIVLSYWSENLSMTNLQKLIFISKYTLEYNLPNQINKWINCCTKLIRYVFHAHKNTK